MTSIFLTWALAMILMMAVAWFGINWSTGGDELSHRVVMGRAFAVGLNVWGATLFLSAAVLEVDGSFVLALLLFMPLSGVVAAALSLSYSKRKRAAIVGAFERDEDLPKGVTRLGVERFVASRRERHM